MNRRLSIFALGILALLCSANAQTLSVEPIEMQTDGQAELVVNIQRATTRIALQFELHLPTGVTAETSNITLGSASDGHTLSVQTLNTGDLLFILYNMDLKAFKDGELLRIPVKVGNNEVSSIGKIYMVRASKADAVSRAYADVVFDVTVKVPEQPVTITADNLTMAYGDNVPSLTYKSSGGTLNGTPSLTTTATKTSPVGTYPITVTKGSATNEKATFVNGTLTITKAPLTITAKSYTIEEGKPLPTFEATYSGWKNNDTQTVLTKQPTFTCSATANSAPGTYDITVSGAEARNYEMGYAKGTLTITVPVGIGQVSADGQQEPIYDLQGRRVDAKNVRKGLYLVNGRKVVIK